MCLRCVLNSRLIRIFILLLFRFFFIPSFPGLCCGIFAIRRDENINKRMIGREVYIYLFIIYLREVYTTSIEKKFFS